MISKIFLLGLLSITNSEIIAYNQDGENYMGIYMSGPCNKPMLANSVSVSVQPYQVSIGEQITINTEYYLDSQIDSGDYSYKATLSGFPVISENGDLCEKLTGSQTPCPLKGWLKSNDNITIASGTPKGKYIATANYSMKNGTTVVCIVYEFNVV